MNMNKKIKNSAIVLILALSPFLIDQAVAQSPPGGSGPPSTGAPCWPPPCIPIDGGVTLLMAAGMLYGGKKLLEQRQK